MVSVLTWFYAAAPVCSPTRASVLTGRSNNRTGVFQHGYALNKQENHKAETLKMLAILLPILENGI